ncbi:MAG: hypothetical protein Q8878_09855, partial [Bacillota bacterium]|nr:hypothetical protein [Bacillota bacterium]
KSVVASLSFTLPASSGTLLTLYDNIQKGSLLEIELLGATDKTKIYSQIAPNLFSNDVFNVFESSDYVAL